MGYREMFQYFTDCFTLQDLTKERNRLAKTHHPDKGGDLKVMQEINAQFEIARKRLSTQSGKTQTYHYHNYNTGQVYSWAETDDFIWSELLKMFNKTQAENLYNNWESWWGQDKSPGKDAKQSRWNYEAEKVKAKREKERQAEEKARKGRKEEIIWAYNQIFQARGKGLLRDCRAIYNFSSYLYVKGKVAPYREWFEQHGFIWNEKLEQWEFDKRPPINRAG